MFRYIALQKQCRRHVYHLTLLGKDHSSELSSNELMEFVIVRVSEYVAYHWVIYSSPHLIS